MKAKILDIQGKEKGLVTLPKIFESSIRNDLIEKVLEAKKRKQPYSPSLVGGKQHSAKGKLVHRRHVWRSQYGRGISRVPRKIFSQKGSNFNWEAAEVPHARGGMRTHPPKVIYMQKERKINKKELRMAFESAISATANKKSISMRYARLKLVKIESLPFIVESNITKLKTKELIQSVKKILGKNLMEVAIRKKTIRSGRGKMRGKKYKKNLGLLMVIGNEEKMKTNLFEIVAVKNLGIENLAEGKSGRLTIYTEGAIENLNKK